MKSCLRKIVDIENNIERYFKESDVNSEDVKYVHYQDIMEVKIFKIKGQKI